ncbi:sugar-binding protein, partial [Streptomyces zhihengii]
MTIALTGSSVQATPLTLEEQVRGRPGVQDFGDPVEGRDAKAAPRRADAARKAAVTALDKAVWPGDGSAELAVAGAAKTTRIGGLPVTVASVPVKAAKSARAAAAVSPAEVRVDVLPGKRAGELGAGAVLRVERSDAGAKPAPVRLTVDYSSFAEGYGGSYASRLRLVQLPACAAVAVPGSAGCPELPKPLATVNDPEARTVSASVSAAPAQAAGASTMAAEAAPLVALAAGPSSGQGSYKATSLAPSASWSVANSSGGFSWNYPMRTVPTPGGLSPTVGLGYSSQSADGRTAVTNNQGSWVGEGFSYDAGFIERRYKPCSDDGHESSGEQCWAFDNASIMLNGTSSELIKDDDSGAWKFASDDGTKV